MKKQTRNTSPNKWRGNKQATWKRIQSNDSKEDKKTFEKKKGNAKSVKKDLEELKNKHTETKKHNY